MRRAGYAMVLCAVLAAVAFGQGKAGEQKKDAAAPAAESPAPRGVAADDAFTEVLVDYQMISGEIARIEKASGTVEIPVSLAELRQRAQSKLAKLRAWMQAHKVGDDWRYDPAAKAFLPPAPPPKADEKPKAPEGSAGKP